jgi:hypothetical protein
MQRPGIRKAPVPVLSCPDPTRRVSVTSTTARLMTWAAPTPRFLKLSYKQSMIPCAICPTSSYSPFKTPFSVLVFSGMDPRLGLSRAPGRGVGCRLSNTQLDTVAPTYHPRSLAGGDWELGKKLARCHLDP